MKVRSLICENFKDEFFTQVKKIQKKVSFVKKRPKLQNNYFVFLKCKSRQINYISKKYERLYLIINYYT